MTNKESFIYSKQFVNAYYFMIYLKYLIWIIICTIFVTISIHEQTMIWKWRFWQLILNFPPIFFLIVLVYDYFLYLCIHNPIFWYFRHFSLLYFKKEGKMSTFLPVSFATKMVFPTSITLTTRYYGTTHQEKDVYFV